MPNGLSSCRSASAMPKTSTEMNTNEMAIKGHGKARI
jgi:hypothetical protein